MEAGGGLDSPPPPVSGLRGAAARIACFHRRYESPGEQPETRTMAKNTAPKTYRWCDVCRRSYGHADAPDGRCPVCGTATREMGKFEALARGFMANE